MPLQLLDTENGVTGAEFKQLLQTISHLPAVRADAEFAKEITRIITAQAGINKEFEVA